MIFRKALAAFAALGFFVSAALGQGVGQLPAGNVWGNASASRAPASPASIMSIIDRGICTTQGAVLYRSATTWVCLSPGTSGLPLLSSGAAANPAYGLLGISGGGTNCSVASGTCLDNITAFASTGYIKRTGAGAYTFVAPPIPVSDGGTGIGSGTSGGVPYFSGTGTLASSGALGANQIVVGGGAGAAPSTPVGLGTTTTVLHGNGAGAPSYAAVTNSDIQAGTITGANIGSNQVANSNLATAGANTWKGNATGSTGNESDNAWTNCNGNNSAVQYTNGTGTGCGSNFANLTVADQTLSGGANVTAQSLTAGNITIDCGSRPLQYISNNAAFTLTAPASDGSCMVLVTNGASAGAITFSGFTVGSSTGDALDTTNGHKFTLSIWRINGTASYTVKALQ